MKFHKQRFRHRPELGEFGDCSRTALACLLDLEPEQIPNFAEAFPDLDRFGRWEREWLNANGYTTVAFGVSGSLTVEEALVVSRGNNAQALMLLTGTSRNGTHHVVIVHNGVIIHDPAIDDSGIVSACNDGLYWFEVLVPLNLTLGVVGNDTPQQEAA